mmetsp:Transcript_2338/g.5756  ORF Transcript_2338/g.5756 Transcript_2338/m.5756 type:complete len:287 (+) Transcript_2338:313-1173(+)
MTQSEGGYYFRRSLASLLYALCLNITSPLIISPPSSLSDFRQLASLLVDTFDAPSNSVKSDDDQQTTTASLKAKMGLLRNMFETSLAEESTYKQYASTARRMRGKKYCLLVAKEFVRDVDDDQLRVRDDVVGMVEMGMSLCPVACQQTDPSSGGRGHATDTSDTATTSDSIESIPQPTIGVLCVKSTHQQKGIGQALVQKCEDVATDLWDEQSIFVDVEPGNENALFFFKKHGYGSTFGVSGAVQMRNATVSSGRIAESRPHFLLRKRMERKNMKEECNTGDSPLV